MIDTSAANKQVFVRKISKKNNFSAVNFKKFFLNLLFSPFSIWNKKSDACKTQIPLRKFQKMLATIVTGASQKISFAKNSTEIKFFRKKRRYDL